MEAGAHKQTDAEGRSGPRRLSVDLLALLALTGLWLHFAASLPGVWAVQRNDFAAYHRSAELVLAGEARDLYRDHRQWFVNLPAVAVALAPLGALDYAVAWRVFWWLQLASFLASFGLLLWGVARYFPPLTPLRAALAAAIFLCFAPLQRRCLVLGQTTPLALLGVTLCWLWLRAGRSRTAGAVLGLVGLLKIPPLLLVPLLALRRRLDVVATASLVVLLGFAVSWLLFGTELLREWADLVLAGNLGRSQAAFNNRGLDGAFMRLFSDRSLLDWDTVPRPWPVSAAVAATLLALCALLWLRGGRRLVWPPRPPEDGDPRRGSLELELAIGLALMVLAFPIVWIHYYLLLALPFALLPFWWQQRGLPVRLAPLLLLAAGGWLASGTDVPANHWYGARLHDAPLRLAQNAQTLGAVLLLLGLSWPLADLSRRLPRGGHEGCQQRPDH